MTRGDDRAGKNKGKLPPNKPDNNLRKHGARPAIRKEREDQMGRALRSVYDKALSEELPGSMLDLLRKLK